MTLWQSLLTVLMASFIATPAFAEENEVEKKFRESAIQAFEEARARGVKEVDGISIDQFVEAAKRTKFVYDPRIAFTVGNRTCAYWREGAKGAIDIATGKRVDLPAQVRINKKCADYSGEDAKAIGVHEVAGVNFKKDLNYEEVMKVLGIDDGSIKGPMLNPTKILPIDSKKASGGSTVVGGGGDGDDIIFRRECHRVLDRVSSPGRRLFGIPYEFFKVAFRKMKVSPAADISTFVEFRGPDVEQGGEPIAYVKSALYRSREHAHKGMLCLSAARLFILYSPESLGLTEQSSDNSSLYAALDLPSLTRLREYYISPALQVSSLMMPRGRMSFVIWNNPEIDATLGKEARDQNRERDLDQYLEAVRDPLYASSPIHNYRALMRVGREVKEYTADSPSEK